MYNGCVIQYVAMFFFFNQNCFFFYKCTLLKSVRLNPARLLGFFEKKIHFRQLNLLTKEPMKSNAIPIILRVYSLSRVECWMFTWFKRSWITPALHTDQVDLFRHLSIPHHKYLWFERLSCRGQSCWLVHFGFFF